MKNILIQALKNNGLVTDEIEVQMRSVKYSGMCDTTYQNQAIYWVLMHDAIENVCYIAKVYMDLVSLEADFAGQVDYEGTYQEMAARFENL